MARTKQTARVKRSRESDASYYGRVTNQRLSESMNHTARVMESESANFPSGNLDLNADEDILFTAPPKSPEPSVCQRPGLCGLPKCGEDDHRAYRTCHGCDTSLCLDWFTPDSTINAPTKCLLCREAFVPNRVYMMVINVCQTAMRERKNAKLERERAECIADDRDKAVEVYKNQVEALKKKNKELLEIIPEEGALDASHEDVFNLIQMKVEDVFDSAKQEAMNAFFLMKKYDDLAIKKGVIREDNPLITSLGNTYCAELSCRGKNPDGTRCTIPEHQTSRD